MGVVDDWAHRVLLARLQANSISGEQLQTVSSNAVNLEQQEATSKALAPHSHRAIKASAQKGPHPDVLDPLDVELPEEDWRYRPDHRSAEERKLAAMEAVSRAFKVDTYSAADTLPHRIRVAYRITREIARVRGLVTDDEALAEGLSPTRDCADPWTQPQTIIHPKTANPRDMISRPLLDLFYQAQEHPAPLHHPMTFPMPFSDETEPTRLGVGGLALVPPEIPWAFRDPETLEPVEDYDPHQDPMLGYWVEAVSRIATFFQIERGTTEETREIGRLGMDGLDDVETVRALWPSRLQIVYWEEALIELTLEKLTHKGIPQVRKELRLEEGLTKYEATTLIKMALILARTLTDTDVEDQRAIMVLRLESYVDRARSGLDLNMELRGLKQLSIVQGLAKTDPEDTLSIFTSIVKDYDSKDAKMIAVKGTARLTG